MNYLSPCGRGRPKGAGEGLFQGKSRVRKISESNPHQSIEHWEAVINTPSEI